MPRVNTDLQQPPPPTTTTKTTTLPKNKQQKRKEKKKKSPPLFYAVDWTTWAPVIYCLLEILYGFYIDGWQKFLENCLLNPLMGGEAGEVARERDLPLYSFQVGHIVPGVGISLLGAFLIYFVGQEYKYADRDDLRSIFVSFLGIVGSAPIVAPLHKLVSEGGMGKIYFDIDLYPSYYIPISFLLSMTITETWFYWFHYLGHKSDFVWKNIHALHHTFIPSTAQCASAFHPFDIFGLTVGGFVSVYTIPIHFQVQNSLLLLNLVWGIYQHSAIRGRLPWLMRLIFNDSMSHTIHHDMGKVPRNLGSLCCLWDRFMGTYQEDPPKWAQLRPTSY